MSLTKRGLPYQEKYERGYNEGDDFDYQYHLWLLENASDSGGEEVRIPVRESVEVSGKNCKTNKRKNK